MKERLGERLKRLLNENGLTPYQFSKKTNVSQSTIGRIINKDSKPQQKNLKIICDFFNVSEQWLLTGVELKENDISENEKLRKLSHQVIKNHKNLLDIEVYNLWFENESLKKAIKILKE
jgi:transcriptional regulator with XRE-family HTH domain